MVKYFLVFYFFLRNGHKKGEKCRKKGREREKYIHVIRKSKTETDPEKERIRASIF